MALLVRSHLAIALACLAAASLASPSSAQVTTTYTYDPQGQVKTVARPANTVTYTYDAAGNRTALGMVYPAPTAGATSLSVAFNGVDAQVALPVSGQVTGATIVTAPAHGYYAVVGTTAHYTPHTGYYGPDSFAYVATGPGGNSAPATVSITVGNPPAPVASNATLNVGYNAATGLALPITGIYTGVIIDSVPAKGSVSVSGISVTYTAAWPNYGADSFNYHATGPGGPSAVRTASLTIANPAAPTAADGSASTSFNIPVTITYPVGGDYAVAALDSQPAHGSVSAPTYVAGVGTQSTYTPQAGYSGPDNWTFHGTSPGGNSPVRTFSINVAAAVNHAPVAVNDGFSMLQNETQDFYVLGNDSDQDGDSLAITAVSAPVRTGGATFGGVGSVTINGNHLTYVAPLVSKFATGEYKYISFTYTISDGRGGAATATVNVSVEGS